LKLDKHIKESDKIEIVGQAEKKHQVSKIGTIRPHKGHTLFQINLESGEVTEAEFDRQDVDFKELKKEESSRLKPGVIKKVVVKKGCIYVSALNKTNAIKKFAKQAQQLL
jgi:hypothetical protein